MSCRKEFTLTPGDPGYARLKNKQTAYYVCPACNQTMKREAIQSTGIDPDLLDPKKFDRLI